MGRWTVGVLCLLASLAVFGGPLLGLSAFYFRDVLHYYWPTRAAVVLLSGVGVLPDWNPYYLSGVPLLGDPHAGVLYPPNQLFTLLAFPRAYALHLVLHHVWAGLGVAALLRREGLGRWGQVAGALAFTLSGYVVGLHSAGPLMAGVAWVPWAACAVRTPQLPWVRRGVLLALVLGLQALSGDPQSVLYSLALAGALVAWGPGRREGLRALALGLALSAPLAAVQLLPAWELLRESTRDAGGFSRHWTLPPARLVELVAPFPYGTYLGSPRFWLAFAFTGPGNIPFAYSVYLGAGLLVLAILGCARDRATGAALTLLGGGLWLALGHHAGLGGLLDQVPPFRFFRYPEKYVLLASLGWTLLVARGADRAARGSPVGPGRLTALWGAGAVLGLGLAATLVLREPLLVRLEALQPVPSVPGAAENAWEAARDSLQTSFTFFALAALALAVARRTHPRPLALGVLLAVGVTDLVLAAKDTVWTAPVELFTPRSPVAEAMRTHAPATPWRFWRDKDELDAVSPRARTEDELLVRRLWDVATLRSNLGSVFGVEEVGGYGAVALQRTDAALAAVGPRHLLRAQVFGACMALGSEPGALAREPGFERVETWERMRIGLYRARACPPRLRTVTRALGVPSREAARERLGVAGLDLGEAAIVEGLDADRQLGAAVVRDTAYGAKTASATVDAPEGGALLVFATPSYPGWRVEVDGRTAPLLHVNVATMGVWVPAGAHAVRFAFRDPGVVPGAALSCVGLLGAALAWAFGGARRRAREAQH